jgi:hypothetical protein
MTTQRRLPRNLPHSFEGQLTARIAKLEAQAAGMAPGPSQEKIRARIRELMTAGQMNEWLRLPRS